MEGARDGERGRREWRAAGHSWCLCKHVVEDWWNMSWKIDSRPPGKERAPL